MDTVSPHLILIILLTILQLAVMARSLLVETRNTYSRAAWLLVLLLLPTIGVVAYILFGEPWVARQFRRRARKVFQELEWHESAEAAVVLQGVPDRFHAAFRICERIGRLPAVDGNKATIAAGSNAAIDSMVRDFDAARQTVHISFYIWLTDRNGLKVVEALIRAASRGVTCRVMADAIGSRGLIRSEYWRAMREAGVRLCVSLKMRRGLAFLDGTRIDLRNHRKIVIVDDRITYCGSQNCSDPEFRIKSKFAPWVDIMMRFEGPVVWQNQTLFVDAWMVEAGEDLSSAAAPRAALPVAGGFPAIAFGTGPMSAKGSMSDVFVGVLYGARREAIISTPYFVPDLPLIEALMSCARRGVKTTLILPARNDSAAVAAMSRATYAEIGEAGVKIFEFLGGMLHAKTLVVDGEAALIGSANMDRRSLELNFENNILLYSRDTAAAIRERQHSYLSNAREVSRGDMRRRPLRRILWQNLLTIFAPVF